MFSDSPPTPNKKQVEEFRQLMKKHYNVEYNDQEAYEAASNFLGFASLMLDLSTEDQKRMERLKKERKGFELEGSYTCRVCKHVPEGQKVWYDKDGMKCFHCQTALEKKIIPRYICKDDDTYYASWQLQKYFGLHHATVRKLVREKKLKVRTIPNITSGGTWHEIYLKKENDQFLQSL